MIAAALTSLVAGLRDGTRRGGMLPRHATFRAVAVAMERSVEMVVSLLAVLKAGGAYVKT